MKILVIIIISIAIVLFGCYLCATKEKKDWNNGICPICGHKLRHFDCDSQGGDGWTCDNCNYTTWVSYHKFVYNEDWLCLAPHGAGRIMSRNQASEQITMEDFKNSMNGIYTTSVNENTIDEAPMAYKSAKVIQEDIKDTVEIVKVIRPIYNFKAN